MKKNLDGGGLIRKEILSIRRMIRNVDKNILAPDITGKS